MNLLKCQRCDHTFEEWQAGKFTEHTRSEFWGTNKVTTEEFLCCPHCGGEELEEVPEPVMCSECGALPPKPGDDICWPCFRLEEDMAADLMLEEAKRKTA